MRAYNKCKFVFPMNPYVFSLRIAYRYKIRNCEFFSFLFLILLLIITIINIIKVNYSYHENYPRTLWGNSLKSFLENSKMAAKMATMLGDITCLQQRHHSWRIRHLVENIKGERDGYETFTSKEFEPGPSGLIRSGDQRSYPLDHYRSCGFRLTPDWTVPFSLLVRCLFVGRRITEHNIVYHYFHCIRLGVPDPLAFRVRRAATWPFFPEWRKPMWPPNTSFWLLKFILLTNV